MSSEYWNAGELDPYAVKLCVRTGEDTVELGSGVIGALSSQGFLFVTEGRGFWVSNSKAATFSFPLF